MESRIGGLLVAALLAFATMPVREAMSGDQGADQGQAASLDVMRPKGVTKTIDFSVERGTNVSLDVSPRGDWLVFDLLGHLYRLDLQGGSARLLTGGSGVALNVTPAVSPDGRRIAFASDRSGQLNLWVMNADGSAPAALTHDEQSRYVDPAWSPDGRSIVVVRRSPVVGFGVLFPRTEIVSVPVDGSAPRVLVKPANDAGLPAEQFGAPAFSPDGKYLFFNRSTMSACAPGVKSSRYRLQRLDLASGQVREVRAAAAKAAFDCATERQTDQETEPRVSPDGRFLAFALTSRSTTLSYRGRDFRPGTALMVRDLATGAERLMISPMASAMTHGLQEWLEINPASISWSADGHEVFYLAGGQIQAVTVANRHNRIVPFRAQVHRVLSQQIKPTRSLDTADTFAPALLQWSSTSPDGKSVVFIAAGDLWIAREGAPAELLVAASAAGPGAALYTPAWSPSGEEVAFASWEARTGGHLWRYAVPNKELRRVTTEAARYLYPVWAKDAASLAYLRSTTPLRMSPQMYRSPFEEALWEVTLRDPDGQTRKLAETSRPQRITFGADGRIRYLRLDRSAGTATAGGQDSLLLESLDARTREERTELSIVPVPWYWPEVGLSAAGTWVSFVLSNRALACRLSGPGTQRRFNISTAAGFDGCRRLDRSGAWFPAWRDDRTIEYTEGTVQLAVDVASGTVTRRPVSVTLRRPASHDLLLRNATLITMDGGAAARRGDILISRRRIACVGRCSVQPGTQTLDLAGKFVIPGIVDTHDHTTRMPNDMVYPGEWKGRASLAFGVTTRYDPFTRTKIIFPLSDLIEAGRVIGPRTYGSGDVINATNRDGGPVAYFDYEWPLRSLQDARFEVTWRARLGVPILKHYWSWSRAQGQWVATAAREAGNVNLTSEGLSIEQELSWVLDGRTQFEHALPGLPIYDDVTRFMGMAGVVYTPTLVVEAVDHFRADARFLAEMGFDAVAPAEAVRGYIAMSQPHAGQQWQDFTNDIQAEAAKDLTAQGGKVSVGSHGEIPGLASHLEIWMLASAMGPHEALRAATVNGAYKLGVASELGSIETGKAADLVVLDADPMADIRNTVRISQVVKAGVLYSRAELNNE